METVYSSNSWEFVVERKDLTTLCAFTSWEPDGLVYAAWPAKKPSFLFYLRNAE
jgi:hypothetical protein